MAGVRTSATRASSSPCSQRVHPTAGALGQRGSDGRQVLAPPLGRGHGRGQPGSLPPAVLGGRGREGGSDPSTASPLSISTEGSCAGASYAFSVSSSSLLLGGLDQLGKRPDEQVDRGARRAGNGGAG